jgi:hypothetical protein
MAFGTRGSGIVDRMAVSAGCVLMIGTISITTTGMREGCIPIIGSVTLCTVCAVHPGMNGWFAMTGRTG